MANYFSHTPPPTSHWEGRDDYVFKPVAIGAGNTALRAEANRSLEGTQLQSHFLIFLESSLVENYNTRFIKKFSQLNTAMQSYRCKDFSLKQVSGLMRGPDPPVPSRTLPPGSATALVPFDILSTAFGINSNTPISSCRFTFWTWNTISIMYRSNRSFNMPPRAYPGYLTPLPSRGGGNLIIRVFQGVGNLNCTLDFM